VPKPDETYSFSIGDLNFLAADAGKWGVGLRTSVDLDNITDDVAKALIQAGQG
jgi:hypothetical protein